MTIRDSVVTTTLFRSRKIRNAATLEFFLTQVRDFCDDRQLPRPPVILDAETFLPFTLVMFERHMLATHERIGCLRLVGEDGATYLEQEWQLKRPNVSR